MTLSLSRLFSFLLCALFALCALEEGAWAQSSRSNRNRRNNTKATVTPKEEKKEHAQGQAQPTAGNVFVPETVSGSASGDNVDDVTLTQGLSESDTKIIEEQGTVTAPEYVAPSENGKADIPKELLPLSRHAAANEASATTRVNARTMALLIPAPRGSIVDRFGLPLAQNVVTYQLALRYGQFEKEDKESIVAYGRNCVNKAKELAGNAWEFSDEALWDHYKHRRWLPLPLTSNLSDQKVTSLKTKLPAGLELLPIYMRFYPQGQTAAHMLGYVGSKGKLPKGPINHMDPLWEIPMGRSGFESYFDKALTGRPGVWRLMFDEAGNKILDELSVKPKPGGTVVTTLNLKWQQTAEKILGKQAKRGAFVLLDALTGEVLVLASNPSFDPNQFVPNISQKDYEALRSNPDNPLVSRAYQGVYPPASTYKAVVGFSALENKVISDTSTIYCPAYVTIGQHDFKNWHTTPEGAIDIYQALARSTNPFFIKISQMMGAAPFLSTSRKLGMGQRTGLPIQDQAGLIPDDKWLAKTGRRKYYEGDGANFSIGQGVIMATPLQVAQFMACFANGSALPKLHIIKQIQDLEGNVIYAATPEVRTSLAGSEPYAAIIRKGLHDVVNGPRGTGARAKLSYTTLCGKTGTGQWGNEKDKKRVAWFAGFLPYDNPRYAFAALYEGMPRETAGGSSKAAPIVKEFFETLKDDIKAEITPVAVEVIEEETPVPAAPAVVASPANPTPVAEEQKQEDIPTPELPEPLSPPDSPTPPSGAPALPDAPLPPLPAADEVNDDSSDDKKNLEAVEVIERAMAEPSTESVPVSPAQSQGQEPQPPAPAEAVEIIEEDEA